MKNKRLVICCAGDQSLHPNWSGKNREFDLMVIYFGDNEGKWRDSADFYVQAKGVKWHLIHDVMQTHQDLISRYETFWCPDDDVDTDTNNVNGIFRCFEERSLALAQPALTRRSYISHRILRQKRFALLRYTNFIEVMAPIMTKEVFYRLSESFKLNRTAWGLDYLWASIVENEGLGEIAILDRYAVTHTRPVNVNGGYYKAMNLDPWSDMAYLMDKYKLSSKQRVYRSVFRILGRDFVVRNSARRGS